MTGPRVTVKLTQEDVEYARVLRNLGRSWESIALHFNASRHIIQSRADPTFVYRERERWKKKKRPRKRPQSMPTHIVERKLPPHEEAMALATIPSDTRNLTARQLGDPLPGRSALDHRRLGL